jgi:hypothetical protein
VTPADRVEGDFSCFHRRQPGIRSRPRRRGVRWPDCGEAPPSRHGVPWPVLSQRLGALRTLQRARPSPCRPATAFSRSSSRKTMFPPIRSGSSFDQRRPWRGLSRGSTFGFLLSAFHRGWGHSWASWMSVRPSGRRDPEGRNHTGMCMIGVTDPVNHPKISHTACEENPVSRLSLVLLAVLGRACKASALPAEPWPQQIRLASRVSPPRGRLIR